MTNENEAISRVLLSIEQFKGNFNGFRDAVSLGKYCSKSKHFSRLLVWKTCLITETLNTQNWTGKLASSRAVYHELRKLPDLKAPWHELDRDSEYYLESSKTKPPHRSQKTFKLHKIKDTQSDPLVGGTGQETLYPVSNKNQDSLELLEMIILDVQRLFPGDRLFHDKGARALHHKRALIQILFIWSKCNTQAGYKQGLHEIIGLIYKNMLYESFEIVKPHMMAQNDLEILSLYDLSFLEHDLFTLFNKFTVSSGIMRLFFESEKNLLASIERFNGLLMKVDQLIHYNLITVLKVDSLLWVIRYLRLILLRELGANLELVSSYWDKLTAAAASTPVGTQSIPDLVIFSIIILLIHLKSELALCDFSEALSLLLHYPISTRLHLYPNFIEALFEDSYTLLRLKDDDLKLYEFGLKLNKKYANVIKIDLKSPYKLPAPENSSSIEGKHPTSGETRKTNLAFEKTRLEMRLKKRAQELLKR